MLNMTRSEVEQLTSEIRIRVQAFAFLVHSDQMPKFYVDLK